MAESRLRQGVCADGVVANSCQRMALEQGNMLEGGCVIDDLGLKASENLVEQIDGIHASQDKLAGHMAGGGFELLLDLEEVLFGGIQQDEAAWTSGCNRPD